MIEWAETEGSGIGAAYDSGVPHTTQTYDSYLDAIEDHDVELLIVEEGDELPLESDELHGLFVNPPSDDSGNDLHSNSVTIVFEFGEFRYVITGDAEQWMVNKWGDDLTADVYQVGHHGSSTSSTQAFMDAVDPDYAIISSDYESRYGHPHAEVLERFDAMGIETYWTGVHGDIVVTTDGNVIAIETTKEFSTDPAYLLETKLDDSDDTDDTDDADDTGDTNDADERDEEATDVGDTLAVAELNVDGASVDEEYIVLENTGDVALDLGSWQIRDREAGGQVARGLSPFRFPANFELAPGERVTIWTGDGDNTDADLYWGYGVNMWRGAGDVIILLNPEGEHVFEHPYGDQT